MPDRRKILCMVGTRPEGIKMAPVIQALRSSGWADTRVVASGQHPDMLAAALGSFGIAPDRALHIARADQELATLTARLLDAIDPLLAAERPDWVLAQGDTTTVMVTALACFYRRIPFGHVEAGLRTGDLDNPFPEEMNRILAGRVATLHFAPTRSAADNLLKEGVAPRAVLVTGNTVIDALLQIVARKPALPVALDPQKRMILVTLHRRESFGAPVLEICQAVERLLAENDDIEVLWPVHLNPNVREIVLPRFSGRPRVTLLEPMDYESFVAAMMAAHLILTDSGGVQEEAPALGKPVLVLRAETERPEAVACGVVKLAGIAGAAIHAEATRLLRDEKAYRAMAQGVSPYGDGKAAGRIVEALRQWPKVAVGYEPAAASTEVLASLTGTNGQ